MNSRQSAELAKAKQVLEEEYAKALDNPVIKTPIAYALYHAWRVFDRKGKRNDQ